MKDYFATPEEDRLDREFEPALKNNLDGLVQQAVDELQKSESRADRRLSRLIEELHLKANSKQLQNTIYRGEAP